MNFGCCKPFGRHLLPAILFFVCGLTFHAAAQTETVIHDFVQAADGAQPYGDLVADSQGNLYGSSERGGSTVNGTIFKMSPPSASSPKWTESVIYSFKGKTDGAVPMGGLIFDNQGNLYGTTQYGGKSDCQRRCGTVFELSPPSVDGDEWKETILYRFSGGADGDFPGLSTLIFDSAGNLYGTTTRGGIYSDTFHSGTVFELSPPANEGDPWTKTLIFSFGRLITTGTYPIGKLALDGAGNIYGSTASGGAANDGTVFRLSPPSGAGEGWSETVIYNFGWVDGAFPYGGVVFGRDHNLYGTTVDGGAFGKGTVFEIKHLPGGGWTESVLYSFNGTDGWQPYGAPTFGNGGEIYATTASGSSYGTVLKLSPPTGEGDWNLTVLHTFGATRDGESPWGNVIFGKGGDLFGTTSAGGSKGYGTVFRIKLN